MTLWSLKGEEGSLYVFFLLLESESGQFVGEGHTYL